ncbi:MAG: T9SS type A sorting domain-containing protein [Saprospiraceae bacterium]
MNKQIIVVWGMMMLALFAKAQDVNIHELIQRTDLTMSQIGSIAEAYFAKAGRVRGTGYKQYERWKYEQKFHLNEDGSFISRTSESQAYQAALPALRNNASKDRKGPTPWKQLGPSSWTRTSGWNPGVGRLTSVAVHPSDEKTMYVSSPGGGLWKTVDGAKSWSPLLDSVNSAWMNFFNLCIAPSDPNTIYAGLSQGGVLKSKDAGVTWIACIGGPNNVKKILVYPSGIDTLFVAADNGLFRSYNGGKSWTISKSGGFQDVEYLNNAPNTIIASANNNFISRSTDLGASWTNVKLAASGRTLLAVSPSNNNIVYAVQAKGDIFGRFYRSEDAGQTFNATIVGDPQNGTNFFGYDPLGLDARGQANYDMAICVNPKNPDEVHIAGIICWKSLNGGSSFIAETAWNLPNTIGYNHADVHGLEYVNDNIYSVSDGGIYVSKDRGEEWTDLSTGLAIRQLYRIACAKTNADAITGGAQDNGTTFRQADGSWLEWLGADGMDCVISPTDEKIAIGTSQYGSIYKTTDGGLTRKTLKRPVKFDDATKKEVEVSGNWVTPITMHPNSHDTVYGGWDAVYRSDNGGTIWKKLNQDVTISSLNCLVIAPSDANYIYAANNIRLFRTSDGGETWTSSPAGNITSICVSPHNPEKIWITTSATANNVRVSTNMGTTFTNIATGLPTIAARSIVVDNERTEGLYVGMNIGVYYKDNVNKKWILHASGLPLVAVNEVELQQSSRKIRVATYGRSIWESAMQAVPESVDAGPNIALHCNKRDTILTAKGGISYLWSTGETTASIKVKPAVTTIYTVTATMSDGSKTTDDVLVKIDFTLPKVELTSSNGLTLDCNVTSTKLTAKGDGNFAWSNGATTATTSINTAGTFMVTVTASNGCTATQSVTMTLLPSTSDTTKINACYAYTWTVNRTTYQSSGIYSEKIACHTKYLILNILPTPNINDIAFAVCDTSNLSINTNTIRCFPNPFGSDLNIYFNLVNNVGNLVFKICDMQGRVLGTSEQGNLTSGNYALRWNLSDLSNGIYNLYMEVDNKRLFTERVVMIK